MYLLFDIGGTKMRMAKSLDRDSLESIEVQSTPQQFDKALGLISDYYEKVKGAGKGFNIVAFLTIGTGVGGARIVGGKPDANVFGFEPGHQIIDLGGNIFSEKEDK